VIRPDRLSTRLHVLRSRFRVGGLGQQRGREGKIKLLLRENQACLKARPKGER